MRSRPRKRRLANAGSRETGEFTEGSLWPRTTPGARRAPLQNVNEAAPAADTASAEVPPGDTPFGFCAALRPLPTCGGQPLRELRWTRRRTNECTLRGSQGGVKGLAWVGWRRTMECRTGLLGGVGIGRAQLRSRC